MIKEHLFIGNGIGTFMALFRSFSASGNIKYAHNCFLQLWAEAGIIAVSIFVLFISKTLKERFSFYKKNGNFTCLS
jgi:O-antigen ligase